MTYEFHRSGHRGRLAWPLRPLLATAVIAATCALTGAPTAFAASTAAPQPIGSAPAVPHDARPATAPSASTPLHLDVELAPRQQGALAAFVAAVSDPHNSQFHHYLAKGQFAAEFGPTAATIDAVRGALSAAGLHPGQVSPDGLTISVDTTVAAAHTALGVDFAGYTMPDGHAAYANTAAPRLSGSVAAAVSGIVGLNNLASAKPHYTAPTKHITMPAGHVHANLVHPNIATPAVCSDVQNGLASKNLLDTRDYWEAGTLSAPYAYNLSQLHGQYGTIGNGVTVGLFELENYSPADIAGYQTCFGTNVSLTNVPVDGGPTAPPNEQTQVGLESALDIETVAGLAPGAAITVYQGPDNATNAQLLDTYQRMITDDTAAVLSTSWGKCEPFSDPALMKSEGTLFAEAAAQGQTMVAAAGDEGSTDCYRTYGSPMSTLAVDDPAGQPDITSVGGTKMTGTSPAVQTAWNDPAVTIQGVTYAGAAGGGGVSSVGVLSGTSDYQSGVQGAGYTNACNAPTGSACRQVPDVSALADLNTGYLIAFGQPGNGQDWQIVGGTSGAAPLWAAIAALADSSTACAGTGTVGLMNPALYAHPGALTDITSGNTDVLDSGYTGGLYAAGTGYDLATGLGTPKAPQVVEALCAAPATPGSTFIPFGPTRVLDTRVPTGVPTAKPIGNHSSISLTIAGVNNLPQTGITAVVLNVTATNTTDGSFLTVYPDGGQRPTASNVNFTANQTVPNLVTVPVGADGKVDIYNLNGTVDVVADVFGYYTNGAGSLYQPMSPVRVLDTRTPPTGVPTAAPVGDHSAISLQLTGINNVPNTGVTAVVLNTTVVNPTASSFLTVYPDGPGSPPTASNLNFTPGQIISNLVTVPVSAAGKVDLYNFNGTVDVVADLFGYYTSGSTGYKFHTTAPHRLLDTRNGAGVAAGQPAPIGQFGTLTLPLSDTNGVGNAGVLANASALALNVTVTGPTQDSFVTVYPAGLAQPPLASNLNFPAGATLPDAAVTQTGAPGVSFYNHTGSTQLVVDVFGYFATN